MNSLCVRERLGKYRIDRRSAEGGAAVVYRARDTTAGIPIALKLPHAGLVTKDTLETFRMEVRLTAGLDHPNILAVKDAGFIAGRFVIAYPLGQETLADRLGRRVSRARWSDSQSRCWPRLAAHIVSAFSTATSNHKTSSSSRRISFSCRLWHRQGCAADHRGIGGGRRRLSPSTGQPSKPDDLTFILFRRQGWPPAPLAD